MMIAMRVRMMIAMMMVMRVRMMIAMMMFIAKRKNASPSRDSARPPEG